MCIDDIPVGSIRKITQFIEELPNDISEQNILENERQSKKKKQKATLFKKKNQKKIQKVD